LWWFWEFYIPSQICRFLGAGTFLTSPRVFVKKSFLRSRRSQCDYTKKHKSVEILENCTQNIWFHAILDWIHCDFENCTFLLRSVDFLELELFWQVSDCLSRKFFWDLAEPNVIIPINIKVWKYSKIVRKYTFSCNFRQKIVIFENCTFLLRSVDFLELELFWQVSDWLSRKIFWDLAEPNVIMQINTKVCKYSKLYIDIHFHVILDWIIVILRIIHSSSDL